MRLRIGPSPLPLFLLLGLAGCSGDSPDRSGPIGNPGTAGVVPFGSAANPKNAAPTAPIGGPGIGGPPQLPEIIYGKPADLVAQGAFSKGNAKLEVLGICKLSETEVSCWSMSGAPDPQLTDRVTKGLEQPFEGTGQVPTFDTRFRRKNRLVIVRNQGSNSDLDARVVNWHIGTAPSQFYSRISIPGITDSKGSLVNGTHGQIVAEKLDAKQTEAHFVYLEPIRGSAELECKAGKSVTFDGMRFTVKSVKKMTSTAWFIQIEADVKSMKGLTITFMPLDKDGRTFEWVNADGIPVSDKERLASLSTDRGAQIQFASPKTSRVRNTFEVLTLVDPTYIGSLSIRGSRTMQGSIEGIPLDPK